MPTLSVLTSLYCSEPYIEELYRRTRAVIDELGVSYEFVFVDDGSPDNGNAVVHKLIAEDSNVRLVELSRNFGHHKAIMVGLEHVSGDYVFMLDSDLEEEPELLKRFWELMQADPDLDVVFGVMEERKGDLFERASGQIFFTLINLMSDRPIPENVMAARLMKSAYVKALVEYQESQLYLAGVMALAGFKQLAVPAKKLSKGRTTYNLSRKVTLAMDALLSFTNKPLTFIAAGGIGISTVSLVVVLYFLVQWMRGGEEVQGWALVLASLWFLGGLIISSIGLVGFYVGRTFVQVKRRPNAIVRKIHN